MIAECGRGILRIPLCWTRGGFGRQNGMVWPAIVFTANGHHWCSDVGRHAMGARGVGRCDQRYNGGVLARRINLQFEDALCLCISSKYVHSVF